MQLFILVIYIFVLLIQSDMITCSNISNNVPHGCTHICFFKLVDVVFAVDQLAIPRVPLVSDQIDKNGGICSTAANASRAYSHSVLYHCGAE